MSLGFLCSVRWWLGLPCQKHPLIPLSWVSYPTRLFLETPENPCWKLQSGRGKIQNLSHKPCPLVCEAGHSWPPLLPRDSLLVVSPQPRACPGVGANTGRGSSRHVPQCHLWSSWGLSARKTPPIPCGVTRPRRGVVPQQCLSKLPAATQPPRQDLQRWLLSPNPLGTACLQVDPFCQFLCLSLFSLSSCRRMVEDVMSVCSLL